MKENTERIQRLAQEILANVINNDWTAVQNLADQLADEAWKLRAATTRSTDPDLLGCPNCGGKELNEVGHASFEMPVLLSANTLGSPMMGPVEVIDLPTTIVYDCQTCDAQQIAATDLITSAVHAN